VLTRFLSVIFRELEFVLKIGQRKDAKNASKGLKTAFQGPFKLRQPLAALDDVAAEI